MYLQTNHTNGDCHDNKTKREIVLCFFHILAEYDMHSIALIIHPSASSILPSQQQDKLTIFLVKMLGFIAFWPLTNI